MGRLREQDVKLNIHMGLAFEFAGMEEALRFLHIRVELGDVLLGRAFDGYACADRLHPQTGVGELGLLYAAKPQQVTHGIDRKRVVKGKRVKALVVLESSGIMKKKKKP